MLDFGCVTSGEPLDDDIVPDRRALIEQTDERGGQRRR